MARVFSTDEIKSSFFAAPLCRAEKPGPIHGGAGKIGNGGIDAKMKSRKVPILPLDSTRCQEMALGCRH